MQQENQVNIADLRERFSHYLKKQRYRNTQERFLVLDSVVNIDKHFSADELYIYVRGFGAKISRATIYSTLDLLTKCNILVKHRFQGDSAHYELADKMPNHDHLICTECGRIIEFQAIEKLGEIQNEVCQSLGFKPLKHSFNIFAVCNDPGHCEYNRA